MTLPGLRASEILGAQAREAIHEAQRLAEMVRTLRSMDESAPDFGALLGQAHDLSAKLNRPTCKTMHPDDPRPCIPCGL